MNIDEARAIAISSLHEVNSALDVPEIAGQIATQKGAFILQQAEVDSLGVIDWCMRIENHTGVDIEPAMFGRFVTLDDLAGYIAQRAK